MDPQTEDFLQILRLIDLDRPLNRLDGWAASADFIKIIYKELFKLLETKESLNLVECGSGVSTVLIGKFLEKYAPKSKLITLDHDHNYYLKTLDELKLHRLTNVELVCAPLKPYEIEKEVWLWYEDAALKNLQHIDALIIDGPPMATQKNARYPALPILFSKFTKETIVLLDDAAREDERNIVKRWKKEFGLLEEFIESEKGICVLKRWEPQEKPLVTIAIPTYNRVEFLKEAVSSALEQSYENIEVVVCDDGSDVDVKQELESLFDDKRLRVIVNEKNMGRPYTRNRLIREANGEYILWLDDDDILEPDVVMKYLKLREVNEDCDVYYGNLLFFGKTELMLYPLDYYKNGLLLAFMLLKGYGSTISNSGTMVKRKLYSQFGEYDEEFYRAQDFEFWCRIATKARFKKLDEIVLHCRVHEGGISGDKALYEADRSFESLAMRRMVTNDLLKISQMDKKKLLQWLADGLEKIFDHFNSLFYRITSKEEHEKIWLSALKLGDLNVIGKIAKNEKEKKNYKELKKLYKLIERSQLDEALVNKIYAMFPNSWLSFYSSALFFKDDPKKQFVFSRASLLCNPFSEKSYQLLVELGKEEEAQMIKNRLLRKANIWEDKEGFTKEYFGV